MYEAKYKLDKVAGVDYHEFIEAIKRNYNPDSNTVLIVDDERGIRMKVARDVRAFDPKVVVYEAANGKEALDKLADIRKNFLHDPLMIILDLNMPVMDGWAVIDALRKDYEGKGKTIGIPIIVLSSTSGEKGLVFKKTVHSGKSGYNPLVSVAKETCTDKSHYDGQGEKGLMAWLEYFMRE